MGGIRTTLTSAFPRPEGLVQATRDLDRGRTTPEKAEAEFAAAETEVRRIEAELRLDSVTGGYLRWPDLFRPFTTAWTGVTAGPLTRFFETNTFYRQPVLHEPPRPGNDHLRSWLPRGRAALGILPGPYTFVELSEVRYASRPSRSPVVDVAAALAEEIRTLGADRPPFLQFQEPSLAYDPPRTGQADLVAAYQLLADASGGSETAVWTYFADAGPAFATLATLPVDVVGFDLLETELPAGTRLGGKGVGLGCIDPTTTLPEEPAAIAGRVRAVEKLLSPSTVWLGPNPPLDLLPFDAAVSKLTLLPKLREVLAE